MADQNISTFEKKGYYIEFNEKIKQNLSKPTLSLILLNEIL